MVLTTLLAAGVAMSMAGLIQQGQAASSAAKAQASLTQLQGQENQVAAEFNAAVARANVEAIRTSAELDIGRQKIAKETMRGMQTVKYAASGVKLEGSPLEVLIDSAAQAELDMKITEFNAKTAASQQEFAATQSLRAGRSTMLLASAQAAQQRELASYYKRSGYMGAAKTLLTSAADFYKPSEKVTKEKTKEK